MIVIAVTMTRSKRVNAYDDAEGHDVGGDGGGGDVGVVMIMRMAMLLLIV